MSEVFGVDVDAAVSEINAKHSGGDAGGAPAHAVGSISDGGAPDDGAPDTALEGDETPKSAEGVPGVEKKPEEKADDGTEFAVTPDGKVRIGDKTYSPVELSLLLEKTARYEAQLAKAREFEAHFQADLEALKQRPALVHKMEEAGYPRQFVERAKLMLRAEGIQIPGPGEPAKAQPVAETSQAEARKLSVKDLPDELIEKIEAAYGFANEQKVAGLADRIGRVYDEYAKSKNLDSEVVKQATKLADAELEALSSKGYAILDEKGQLRSDIVRKVFQSAHRSLQTQIDKRVRSVVTDQRRVNASVRDRGNGGVVPSRPAETPKTLKDARQSWLRELEG